MTADAGWLSAIALGYLVAINAVANGCRLAPRDALATAGWPANLARGIAAADNAWARLIRSLPEFRFVFSAAPSTAQEIH